MNAENILTFWYDELTPKQWFQKSDELDAEITSRFKDVLNQCRLGECYQWRATPEGRLAEIIVLDQFSRNIYRDSPDAFAQDPMSLALAQEAVALGADSEMSLDQKSFLYMPYMHSESRAIHEVAVELFDQPGLEEKLRYEMLHKEIVDRFGRYPHRNAILGRESTPEEVEFLQQPGSSF